MDYKINTPIWATREVGLNESQLQDHNTVEILYVQKDGARLYPHTYKITREQALRGRVDYRKGIRLRVIPIDSLEIATK